MFSEYLQERYAFINEIQKMLLSIKNKFESLEEKMQIENLDSLKDTLANCGSGECMDEYLLELWDNIEKDLNGVLSFANRFPLDSKYYCLTKEYEDIRKVLNNSFWILTACLYTEYGGRPHFTEAYNKLIFYINKLETISIERLVFDMNREANGTEIEYARIRQLEIDNDLIIPSEDVCWREDYSIIRKDSCVRADSRQKSSKILFFKPAKKLKPILEREVKCGSFSAFAYPFGLFFYLVKNDFSNINVWIVL